MINLCGLSYSVSAQVATSRLGTPTLPALCGLLISISGDLSSFSPDWLGDFGSLSSCASSSISVVSVPFESTGDGSIWAGYGLGGGARESEGPDDL